MGGRNRRIDRRVLRAEYIYPVRLRLRVPPLGLRSLASDMDPWLRQTCGHRKFWTASGPRLGVVDSMFVYLPSAEVANTFVDFFKCSNLIQCVPHPSPEVGDPVYDPDN